MLYSWTGKNVQPDVFREQFSDVIRSHVISCDCYVDDCVSTDGHETKLSSATLGHVSVSRYSSMGIHTARRTREHVSREASDDLLLYIPLTSSYIVRQGGKELELRPGTLAFVTLDKPLEGIFIGKERSPVVGANIRLPMSLVRARLPRIEECLLGVIPVESGAGRIMLSLLQASFDEAPHLNSRSAKLVGSGLLDTICAFGHAALECRPDNTPLLTASRQLTRARVEEFIMANLANPDLCPSVIAARCNVSLRCLHMAFNGSGWTVAAWIKEQRLLQCHRELRDADLSHRTVADIAYGWGFKDLSHFSRAYKTRFSVPPSQERSARVH